MSGTFPAGSFPVVTGGGEEVTGYTLRHSLYRYVTLTAQIVLSTSPAGIGHLAITSRGNAGGSVLEVDNEAVNGVIHVIDIVL